VAANFWERGFPCLILNNPTQALIDECRRQSENCGYTSSSFTIWLRWLRWIQRFFLAVPVAFGALATWKILAQTSPMCAAFFTLLATAIPPTYHALKIDAAIDKYTRLAGEFTNLRDRFRQAALINSQKSFSAFEADCKPLFERFEKARKQMLTPPEWCFKLARRKHKAGHYHHDYDERSDVTTALDGGREANQAAPYPSRP